MRRPLLIVLIVLSALTATEVIFRLMAPALPDPSTWYSGWAETKAELIAGSAPPPDVVFLGDSSTMNGLNPNQFAEGSSYQNVFNAGIPGVTPVMIEDWYRRVVEPACSPSLVLIGLTTHTVTMGEPGPYFESLALDEGWPGAVNRWLYENSWTARYRGVARDPVGLVRHYVGTGEDHWDRLDSHGWFTPPDRDYEAPTERSEDARIRPEDRGSLVSLVEQIREDGADVVLVRMPETRDRADTYEKGAAAIDTINEEIERLARSLSVPIVDLSEISSRVWFTDSLHLDPRGARLAGELLLAELEELSFLRMSAVAVSR